MADPLDVPAWAPEPAPTERPSSWVDAARNALDIIDTFQGRAMGAASLGLTDVASRQLAPEVADEQRRMAEEHPIAATAGELAGMLVPGSPAARASSFAERAAARFIARPGAGLVERTAARAAEKALGQAVENPIWSVGQDISEAELQDKPLVAEHVFANAGMSALLGGAIGAGLGAGGELAGAAVRGVRGIVRGRTAGAPTLPSPAAAPTVSPSPYAAPVPGPSSSSYVAPTAGSSSVTSIPVEPLSARLAPSPDAAAEWSKLKPQWRAAGIPEETVNILENWSPELRELATRFSALQDEIPRLSPEALRDILAAVPHYTEGAELANLTSKTGDVLDELSASTRKIGLSLHTDLAPKELAVAADTKSVWTSRLEAERLVKEGKDLLKELNANARLKGKTSVLKSNLKQFEKDVAKANTPFEVVDSIDTYRKFLDSKVSYEFGAEKDPANKLIEDAMLRLRRAASDSLKSEAWGSGARYAQIKEAEATLIRSEARIKGSNTGGMGAKEAKVFQQQKDLGGTLLSDSRKVNMMFKAAGDERGQAKLEALRDYMAAARTLHREASSSAQAIGATRRAGTDLARLERALSEATAQLDDFERRAVSTQRLNELLESARRSGTAAQAQAGWIAKGVKDVVKSTLKESAGQIPVIGPVLKAGTETATREVEAMRAAAARAQSHPYHFISREMAQEAPRGGSSFFYREPSASGLAPATPVPSPRATLIRNLQSFALDGGRKIVNAASKAVGAGTRLAVIKGTRTKDADAQEIATRAKILDSHPEALLEHVDSLSNDLHAHAPEVAGEIRGVAIRAQNYLAQHAPAGANQGLLDANKPDPAQDASYRKRVAALADPQKTLERVAAGQASPEEIDALKSVYPATWAAFQGSLSVALAGKAGKVSQSARTLLTKIMGQPMDRRQTVQRLQVNQVFRAGLQAKQENKDKSTNSLKGFADRSKLR